MLGTELLLLRRAMLLVLLLRRCESSLVASGHDAADKTVARRDRGWWLLGRSAMLWRSSHTWLASAALTSGSFCKLVSEHAKLLFVPIVDNG
jgi:hypothetical protein